MDPNHTNRINIYILIFRSSVFCLSGFMMDYHQQQLGNVCRVCGLKLKKSKKYCPVYDCNEYFTQLHKTFHIEVRHNNPLVHPPSFCSLCHGITRRTMTALDSWTTYTPASTPIFHWEPHTEQECRVRCCN